MENVSIHKRPLQEVCLAGFIDVLPLAIAVIPWGILCGSLAIQSGFTSFEAALMSALVFAGAAQLGGLTVIAQGGALSSITGATFVISARHLLYSATFREDVRYFSFPKKAVIAFLLTDEMFAVTENYKRKTGHFSAEYAISSGVTFWLLWNISTIMGISLDQQFPSLTDVGLNFAIAATFIAIVVPNLNNISTILAALSSFTLSIVFENIGFSQSLLMAAITGMFLGYLFSTIETKK